MSDMMRGGRYNRQCRCCNDSECKGYREREERQWRKDVEDEVSDWKFYRGGRPDVIRQNEQERIIALLKRELGDVYNTGDDWEEGYKCALSTMIQRLEEETDGSL